MNTLSSRYFADGKGLGSEFEAFFTTLRLIGPNEEVQECSEEEYDCDDATCISKELGRAQLTHGVHLFVQIICGTKIYLSLCFFSTKCVVLFVCDT